MSDLHKAMDELKFWRDFMISEQEVVSDPSESDQADRALIHAIDRVLRELYEGDDYVAWLRWNGRTYVTCDSDDAGAFRVYSRMKKGGAE